jgi:hypothetical protein
LKTAATELTPEHDLHAFALQDLEERLLAGKKGHRSPPAFFRRGERCARSNGLRPPMIAPVS